MVKFLWIDWNVQKIDNHALSTDEVEFAWLNGRDGVKRTHPVHGVYWERIGKCPSGRVIRIVWRWNEEGGERSVFVITAF